MMIEGFWTEDHVDVWLEAVSEQPVQTLRLHGTVTTSLLYFGFISCFKDVWAPLHSLSTEATCLVRWSCNASFLAGCCCHFLGERVVRKQEGHCSAYILMGSVGAPVPHSPLTPPLPLLVSSSNAPARKLALWLHPLGESLASVLLLHS